MGDTDGADKIELALAKIKEMGAGIGNTTSALVKLNQELTKLEEMKIEINFDTSAFQDQNKELATTIKSFEKIGKLAVSNLQYEKKKEALSAQRTKDLSKAGDDKAASLKIETKYIDDQKRLESEKIQENLAGWGQIAGAMSGAFKQGSDAAMAFQAIQIAIATVSAGQALITAWADPTIPAVVKAGYVATVAANVFSLLSMIGGSGSGGGGGLDTVESSRKAAEESTQTAIDLSFEPMLKKLDTQIALLEQIEKNGSASRYSISQAKQQYEYDFATYANQISSVVGGTREVDYGRKDSTNMLISMYSFQELQNAMTKFGIDASGLFAGIHNPHKTVFYNNSAALNTQQDLLAYIANRDEIEAERDKILSDLVSPATDKFMTDAEFSKIIIDVEAFIGEFAVTIGDSLTDLKDMSMTFQDL
jgi:hypothetical protein